VFAYKQAQRRDDDIAIVNGAFYVRFDQSNVVRTIRLAYGGMAPTTRRATHTESLLVNRCVWSTITVGVGVRSVDASQV
jgi:xanthine dehydrogenase/oxidase